MLYGIEEFRKATMDDDTREPQRPSSGEKVSFEDFCRMIPYQTDTGDVVEKCLNSG